MADQPLSKYALKMMARVVVSAGGGPNAVERAVQDVIGEAIKDERERCAKIAEAAINNMNGQAKSGMARAIARRIRNPEQ